MSNLKDTDFDDLLRRASDEYPLRTDSTDWDRMAAALEKAPPPDDGDDVDDKRKKRRFLWLFLLLPLGMLGYYTWHGTGNSMATVKSPAATTTAGSTTTATAAVTTTATTPATAAATTTATTPATGEATTSSSAATGAASSTGTATSEASGATSATASTRVATNRAGTTYVPGRTAKTTGVSTVATGGSATADGSTAGKFTAGATTASRSAATSRSAAGGKSATRGRSATGGGRVAGDRFLAANTTADDAGGVTGSDRIFFDLQRAFIAHNYHLSVDVTAPAPLKDSAKQKTSSKTKTSYLYAGLILAPDLSTVKMQSIKGVGTTYGVLLGYAFSKHWSIESGAYVDRKRYYTEGEYFDTKGVHLPAYAKLDNVDGTCYMWEIPLNIRYNFNPGAKTSWFATAGFSTYLMTHENYTYAYQWMNSSTVKDSTWNLKRPSQYPFSIINLSAGFEQRLGKIGNLRVEPYVRIPLTGMGTGKLPIMSTGVNIGITRQLWK